MALEFEKEQETATGYQTPLTGATEDETPAANPSREEAPDFDDIDDDIVVPDEDKAPDFDAQLDLFGGSEPTKAAAKKQPAKKAATPAPAAKSTPKVDTKTKVGSDYNVYYAGHSIPVPQDDMSLEQLRSFLEADFPEMSKERTKMTVNTEKKQVVPVIHGGKNG
ncbi:hypothetical protein C2I27_03670 [Priestia megaterium]|uniref:hypothetical protein n=1 Tax=Priestia megaterium TaxID=1404 RepID=UPI000D51CADD|nr:hypothetical protein [Priestia megaterium]PVC74998.1 hypothetical protein C2I27_03670 [Priestia megaterium]